VIAETPRLVLREIVTADTDGLYSMDSDPEVHRYLGGNHYTTIQQSRDNVTFIRQQYQEHGIGRWAIILKETDEFVGWTGFKRMVEPVNGHVGHLDFGYRLARKHWRKGYGFEASRVALDYGIRRLGFRDIYAMTHIANMASRGLLEKLGFELEEIFAYNGANLFVQGESVTWYSYLHEANSDTVAQDTSGS
jgi:ribosomal-protein-alanine N-acetyltransferase